MQRASAAQVLCNLVTPRNGEIVVSMTQDFLTGAYLLSHKSVFLTRDQFSRLVAYMSDANERVELPPPAIIKPIEMWTGKQVFSLMLRPTTRRRWRSTSRRPTRSTTRRAPSPSRCTCAPTTATSASTSRNISVAFQQGHPRRRLQVVPLRGAAARPLGGGISARDGAAREADCALPHRLWLLDWHPGRAAHAAPDPRSRRSSTRVHRVQGQDPSAGGGQADAGAGCTPEQTLESEINGLLSKIRDDAGEICKHELHHLNAPLTMATCGSKGSSSTSRR